MRGIAAAWVSLWIVLTTGAASAQTCPVSLRPAEGGFGYRYRATPDRCEGLYTTPVAGEGLELLSFLSGAPASQPGGDKTLQIIAPDLRALGAPKVSVVGRALPLRVYYRMDATVAAPGALRWPVGEVVLPAGLDPASIGLLGSVRTSDGSVYVPLGLAVADTETSGALAPGPMTVVVRAPLDLDSVQWRLYAPGGNAPNWNRVGHPMRAGDPITISLDPPSGKVMMFEIAARPVGSDYIQGRYRLFRP